MNVLALDTSGALTSVALIVGGEVGFAYARHTPRGHVEEIGLALAAVREDVDRSSLDAVACGVGPGPYTGLRVGVAAALALGAAWGVPAVGVCSLDAVAACARERVPGPVGVALDARRREVYWATYDADGTRTAGPQVGPADGIHPVLRSGAWVGSGVVAHEASFGSGVADDAALEPHAEWVARIAARELAAGRDVDDSAELPLSAHGTDSGGDGGPAAGTRPAATPPAVPAPAGRHHPRRWCVNDVTIRPMRWWDIDAVHALEAELFPADAWSVEQFWGELAQPTRDYLVAVVDEAVVAYGGTSTLPPDADLQTIAVAPAVQGRGIAGALLRSLLIGAAARGARRIVLEVRADNDPAHALYRRFGFTQIARRAQYYPDGGDALIWQASLVPGCA